MAACDTSRSSTLTDNHRPGTPGSRCLADSGTMAESADGKDLVLTLHSGEIYEFQPNEPGQLQQIKFIDNTVMVRDVQNNLDLAMNGQASRRTRDDRLRTPRFAPGTPVDGEHARDRRASTTRATTCTPLPTLPLPAGRPAELPHPKIKEYCGMGRRLKTWAKGIVVPQKLRAQEPPQNPVPPPVQQVPTPAPQAQTPAPQVPTRRDAGAAEPRRGTTAGAELPCPAARAKMPACSRRTGMCSTMKRR